MERAAVDLARNAQQQLLTDMSYPVGVTCNQCGFSLHVSEDDVAGVPGDLSPEAKVPRGEGPRCA